VPLIETYQRKENNEKSSNVYDPKNLPKLVEQLKGKRGRHLVVGHSDTTPAMVELLGGDPGSKINDESEYDRL